MFLLSADLSAVCFHMWLLIDLQQYTLQDIQGLYSLNLLYSKENLKNKDFLYFLLLPLFWYSLNFIQAKATNFLSLNFKETLRI